MAKCEITRNSGW